MPFPIKEVGTSGNRGYPVRMARDGERGFPCQLVAFRGMPVILTDGSYGVPIRIVAGDDAGERAEGGSEGVIGSLIHPDVSGDTPQPIDQTDGSVNALLLMGWTLGISDRLTVSQPDQTQNVMLVLGWLAGNFNSTEIVTDVENFSLAPDSEYIVFNMGWI